MADKDEKLPPSSSGAGDDKKRKAMSDSPRNPTTIMEYWERPVKYLTVDDHDIPIEWLSDACKEELRNHRNRHDEDLLQEAGVRKEEATLGRLALAVVQKRERAMMEEKKKPPE